jgi:hypothetical protein
MIRWAGNIHADIADQFLERPSIFDAAQQHRCDPHHQNSP